MLLNLLIYGILIALIESFLNAAQMHFVFVVADFGCMAALLSCWAQVFLVQDFDHAPKVIIGAATAVTCLTCLALFNRIFDINDLSICSLATIVSRLM